MYLDLLNFRGFDELFKQKAFTTVVEDASRQMQVAEMKEIYSREYLLNNGFCTREEYDSIQASTERADYFRSSRIVASLMSQVVGADVHLESWR
jgi:hypothetical protein